MKAERPTLLVVDDEPEVLQSVHDLFRREYRVLTFERGRDALRSLEEESAPVIMSDQRMPEMSGIELLGEVKRIRPETTRLLFTGYADIRAVIDAINQGSVFRYIAKPWEDAEELTTVVRQAVQHHDLIVERNRLIAELRETNARLLEANRLKGSFIEVASHELKTPVSVVLGMTELWRLMQGASASPAEHGWVDRIEAAGKRLHGTIQKMFQLLDSGQFDHNLDLRETELEPLIRRSLCHVKPLLQARRQEVVIEAAPGLGSAQIDPEKIGDVLVNLIGNAVKFTPDDRKIVVAAEPVGADHVRFRVIDPGVGIRECDRQHLFEPFYTGDDTRHHSSGDFQFGKQGIGLGLCLVKKFVELHGGSVEFDSTREKGSCFGFTLPRRSPERNGRKRIAD